MSKPIYVYTVRCNSKKHIIFMKTKLGIMIVSRQLLEPNIVSRQLLEPNEKVPKNYNVIKQTSNYIIVDFVSHFSLETLNIIACFFSRELYNNMEVYPTNKTKKK